MMDASAAIPHVGGMAAALSPLGAPVYAEGHVDQASG